MSRLTALTFALLMTAAGGALADPPEWRGGHRGGRGDAAGEHRGDGPRGGDHWRGRSRGGEDAGSPPPVTSNEPGRGARSWADRPRFEGPPHGQDVGRGSGENDFAGRGRDRGPPQGGQGGVVQPPSGQAWQGGQGDRGRGDRPRDYAGRDNAGPPPGTDRWRDNGGPAGPPNAGDERWRDRGGRDGRPDDRGRGDGRNGDDNRWRDNGRNNDWGRDDHRWRGDGRRYADNSYRPGRQPGYGRPLRDRDAGRHWYEPNRYYTHHYAPQRYRVPVYVYPRGYYVRAWRYGEYLPGGWYDTRYYLDWRYFGLPYPPIGCEWVRVGDNALLVDVWTGEILSVWYDLFW
jgi:Ni/Co efflux regulator RcnB